MAAEESSQEAALGPEFSEPPGGDPPDRRDIPDLNDVLGEFMEALCVVEMVYRALHELMEECPEQVGSCAIALRHGYQMLDAVYSRFDLGLLSYDGPGGGDDEPFEDERDNDPGGEDGDPDRGNPDRPRADAPVSRAHEARHPPSLGHVA